MKAADLANPKAPHSLPYMQQLDSLRAIAVLAIIYSHYVRPPYWPFGIDFVPLATRGFFVLSGFLITTVLLRDLAASPSLKSAYGAFIARRALRLFPILLVILVVTAILDVPRARETLVWNLSFLTNVYMATLDKWPEAVGDLWTVSAAAQFYLLWPIVLFALPRRYLPTFLVVMIVSGVIFRIAWREFGPSFVGAEVLTPSAFDAFGLGALLAIYRNNRTLIATIGLVGAGLWLVTHILFLYSGELAFPKHMPTTIFYLNKTAAAMVFVWLVKQLADGVPGIAGRIIALPPIIYIGMISYGIFILHMFAPYLLGRMGFSLPLDQYYLACFVMTLVLAALSWHLLELPIMRAGRRWMEPPAPTKAKAKRARPSEAQPG
jgi:peptidoglycan/LPS O-acetylase OafA/YrhL